MTIDEIMRCHASTIEEFWFDVDGVMTAQSSLVIYDINPNSELVGFVRKDGVVSTTLLPCSDTGEPLQNHVVEYIAGFEGEPIMEGYRFDTRDGKAVEYLTRKLNLPVFFISGRNSPCVRKRACALGATPLLGEKDKLPIIRKVSKVGLANICFVGDGTQDLEAMSAVNKAGGLTIAPLDSCSEVLAEAKFISSCKGGQGVLNEAIGSFLKEKNFSY